MLSTAMLSTQSQSILNPSPEIIKPFLYTEIVWKKRRSKYTFKANQANSCKTVIKNMNGHIDTVSKCILTLRKHAYSNILKSFPPKTENFQIKNSDIFFHYSA